MKHTLALLLACTLSVHAATVQFSIVVDTFDPQYTAVSQNLGLVTYDETALSGVGDETLRFDEATVSLKFDDQWYAGSDDALYPQFPEFYFTDGEFVGLSLEVTLKSPSANPNSYLLVDNQNVFYSFDGTQEFEASMVTGASAVPEPASALMLAVSLGCIAARRRRS